MARGLYLLCYDIADPKRLARVFKAARAYRVAGQKSVFECWLTTVERRDLLVRLDEVIDPACDRVHCFALDPRAPVRCHGIARSFAGPPFVVF